MLTRNSSLFLLCELPQLPMWKLWSLWCGSTGGASKRQNWILFLWAALMALGLWFCNSSLGKWCLIRVPQKVILSSPWVKKKKKNCLRVSAITPKETTTTLNPNVSWDVEKFYQHVGRCFFFFLRTFQCLLQSIVWKDRNPLYELDDGADHNLSSCHPCAFFPNLYTNLRSTRSKIPVL